MSIASMSPVSAATGLVAGLVSACFQLVPSLPLAVVLASAIAALVTAPLTIKGFKASRALAQLQPGLAVIRKEHADDPEALATATLAAYRDAGARPLRPCVYGALQALTPMFLFRVLRGVTHRNAAGSLVPRYVSGAVAQAIRSGGAAFAGVDMTTSALAALHGPPLAGLVVGLLGAVVLLVALAQRRAVRTPAEAASTMPAAARLGVKLEPALVLGSALFMPIILTLSLTTMGAFRAAILWFVSRHPPSA